MTGGRAGWLAPAPVMAVAVAAGLAAQVYLAGLAVFGAAPGWEAHRFFGGMVGIPILGLAAYGWLGRGGGLYRRPATLLLVLYGLQFGLAGGGIGAQAAWVGALHPVNALAMLLAAADVLRRSAPKRGMPVS
tara:strand:+ start:3954 stop:4349 length:396 start_codon:yes stop_codon:yes gene_type:complete